MTGIDPQRGHISPYPQDILVEFGIDNIPDGQDPGFVTSDHRPVKKN